MKIKKDSLHYRLYDTYACGYSLEITPSNIDFCQYARTVIEGLCVVFMIIVLGVFLGLGVLQVVGSVGLWAITDNPFIFLFPTTGETPLVGKLSLIAGIIEGVGILWIGVAYIHKGITAGTNKEPGFIKTWYLSWKQNYCPIVKLDK